MESRDVEAGAGRFEFPEDGEQLDHDLDRWGVRDFKKGEGLNICRSTRHCESGFLARALRGPEERLKQIP